MKKIHIIWVLSALCVFSASCKKAKNTTPANALGSQYPLVFNKVLTPAIVDSFKKAGMNLNTGLTPPTADGTYFFSPSYCTYDNSGDNLVGDSLDSYNYKFANQNNITYTISVKYEDVAESDTGSDGAATYIMGSGTSFTIVAKANGVFDNVNYATLQIITGQIVSGGISNMQIGTYLESKSSDPDGEIEAVGSTRIFTDPDLFSQDTTFAFKPVVIQGMKKIKANSALLASRKFLLN